MTDNATPALPFGVSREQYDAAAMAATATPGSTPQDADELDPATQAALESFDFAPPGEPAQYSGTPHDGDMTFDTTARQYLGAAEFPREVGSTLLAAMHKYEHASAGRTLTDGERELSKRSTEAALQRTLGEDYAPMVELARTLAQHIEKAKPGFIAWLESSGAGNDVRLITAMGFQAYMLKARGPL